MSLVQVENLEKSYGSDTLFTDVTFQLGWGQKVGLVGHNGAGKTTLVRILAGEEVPDRGRVNYARGVRFGYLRQEEVVNPQKTVLEEAQSAFAPILEMERRMRQIEAEIGSLSPEAIRREDLDAVIWEYSQLQERFEIMGGYAALRDVPQVLYRLGFAPEDLSKPCGYLSGGEKTRLALARVLLSGPDVLYLDEPTNHLDIEAIEWLESYLKGFGGALLLVSHDRYFLDRIVTQIAELDSGRLTFYRGNYTNFQQQKQALQRRIEQIYEREQREIARLIEFYEKWKSTPTRRNQAMARKRWAERLEARLVEPPKTTGKKLRAKLQPERLSGSEVLVFEGLTKQYGGKKLFENVSGVVRRGERIGIVGPNGAGKSTLVRILLGRETPDAGIVRFGLNVTVGYFAQDTSDLDLEATVLENMVEVGTISPFEARTHLARFLFVGDDVFRPVKFLSGGEKNKLVLAQITWLKPNLLVLDEPTNHLDIESREALVQMLKDYEGTLLLVSHDRYLLDQTTEKTLELAGGQARWYDMPYSLYRERRQPISTRISGSATSVAKVAGPDSALGRLLAESPRKSAISGAIEGPVNGYALNAERRKARKQVEEAERRVEALEKRLKELEERLYHPRPTDNVVALSQEYQGVQQALEEALRLWEEAASYAEKLGA
ncbi:ribosomal protection-like ABC-F family protein [Chthonomonas calidirosea]|uniref:ribosomal protection-like ABC-F family protein n=1 Tax=Chthonomonas calidirosea TaxID=454171 RepID=UPI0006EC5534|nr:ABC-F family ATP-binding cassette domain-containing protein [Chthonomonas calidirosea]CEK16067.1 ATPase component of ABC transporters with duplicated ATPase domain [Chthonomonas calidirosea]